LVMNKEWLLGVAKAKVLQLVAEGYRPPAPRTDIPAIGQTGLAQLKCLLYQMRQAGQISAHDEKIGLKLAHVLCGGDLSWTHFVSEQYILDLEREVFLSLCGEPKTLDSPVREVMDAPFPIVDPESPIALLTTLLSRTTPAALVRRNGKVVGIVTRYDLLHQLAGIR